MNFLNIDNVDNGNSIILTQQSAEESSKFFKNNLK